MQQKPDNSITIIIDGQPVQTLRDILPKEPGLRVLFVAKTPAPKSVEAGHYFQGKQGRMFWNRLKEYGLFVPTTEFEDDSLLDHGFGLTDIVKVPRAYGNEPSDTEYRAGMARILDLVHLHHPKVVVFIYKGVLDQILRFRFGIEEKASYGFNTSVEAQVGTRVFVFPMPGTPCTSDQAVQAMNELVKVCGGSAAE